MANTTLRGFRWVRSEFGTGKPPIAEMPVASAYGTVLCPGDALKFAADGSLARAAAGDALVSHIMVGVRQYWDGTIRRPGKFLPVSTWGTDLTKQSIIRCIPVTGQVFEVDADDGTTAATETTMQALINENCDLVVESGSLNISYMALDISTHVTTSAQFRIVDISKRLDQDFTASRVKLLVQANESELAGYLTTVSA